MKNQIDVKNASGVVWIMIHKMLNSGKIFYCLFITTLLVLGIAVASGAEEFTASEIGNYGDVTVLEVTGNYDVPILDCSSCDIPRQEIAKEFYKTHPDNYDFIIVFSNFNFQMPRVAYGDGFTEALGFYSGVKNDVSGIGERVFDNSKFYGSDGNLQGTIDMGYIGDKVTDPYDPLFSDIMGILSHELLHRWAAFVTFKDSNGQINSSLIGLHDSHWSYLLDTRGSVQYGNHWQDNGDGTFTSLARGKYYSPLDLYLMGLIDKSQVPPMLLIDNLEINGAKLSRAGVTIDGTAMEVTIDDIIAAEGERIPDVMDSQKSFKIGCVLITRPGAYKESDLEPVRNVMRNWSTWFSALTDGRASLHIDADPIENISINPGVTTPVLSPRDLPADLYEGVAWLKDNQHDDGKWQDAKSTAMRDTSETLLALNNFTSVENILDSTLLWLENNTSGNIDYLSRKIIAFSSAGRDASMEINSLLSKQNINGGWGGEKSYSSNALDSSFAIKALALSGNHNVNVIVPTVEYLKINQHPDGGWGDDRQSNVRTTTNVLTALYHCRDIADADEQIRRAMVWLKGKQNVDGGFGNSASTVYDTSDALLVLGLFGEGAEIIFRTVEYLKQLQDKDGSWFKSAYQTASSVTALWMATKVPDCSVSTSDITLEPDKITTIPSDLNIKALVRNRGLTAIPEVKVSLYLDQISEASIIDEKTITLAGDSSVETIFSVAVKTTDERRYYIVADRDNGVAESNEDNNIAIKLVRPAQEATYDFGIEAGTTRAEPGVVDYYDPVRIKTRVYNRGTLNGYKVPVKWYLEKDNLKTMIASFLLDIESGKSVDHEFTWKADLSGDDMTLLVAVDPGAEGGNFPELSEDNNGASVRLSVNPVLHANISVDETDIGLSPLPALVNGELTVSAKIKNNGFLDASAFGVNCFRGLDGADQVLLGRKMFEKLGPGESVESVFVWTGIQSSGEEMITVQIDPMDNNEISTGDNSAFRVINILSLPDLVISERSIVFNPPVAKEGDVVTVAITVQNAGEQEAGNVKIVAYDGDGVVGPSDLRIEKIPGNSQAVVSFAYDTSAQSGTSRMRVVLDSENEIREQREENNEASRILGIQDSDNWLTESYISPNGDGVQDSTFAFFRLEIATTVTVVVLNSRGNVVKTFNDDAFRETDTVTIEWDGLDERGVVVPDGQYRLQVQDDSGSVLSMLNLVVDNNRSPLSKAFGTDYLLHSNLTCAMPDISRSAWFPDESGLVALVGYFDAGAPEYPEGIYTITPDGEDIKRIVPFGWTGTYDDGFQYYYSHMDLSPDASKVLFFFKKRDRISRKTVSRQIWSVDRDGGNLVCLATIDPDEKRELSYSYLWAPDNATVGYGLLDRNTYPNTVQIWAASPGTEGIENKLICAYDLNYPSNIGWAPGSRKLLVSSSDTLRIFDLDTGSEGSMVLGGYKVETCRWLNDDRVFVGLQNDDELMYALIDSSGELVGSLFEGFDVPSLGWRIYSTAGVVHPYGKYVAYINMNDEKWYLNICNVNGEIKTLHESDNTVSELEILSDLKWSPDGKKIAFVDHAYTRNKECFGDGYLVTVDIETLEKRAVKVEDGRWDLCEVPTSYHIMTQDNGSWVERGVLHYGSLYETKEMDLSKWYATESGSFSLRMTHKGTAGANVDYISLLINGTEYQPCNAVNVNTGDEILYEVARYDGRTADVLGATVDYSWKYLPPNPGSVILVMNANEGKKSLLFFYRGSLLWLHDNTSVLYKGNNSGGWSENYGFVCLDVERADRETGEGVFLSPEPGVDYFRNVEFSPKGTYLAYDQSVPDSGSACSLKGSYDKWVISSLLNMTATLRTRKSGAGIELKGTAADLNFDSYALEYADADSPEIWNMVVPPSEIQIVNDLFTVWVPPGEGSYFIRLTVHDRAGNTLVEKIRISWGRFTSITGLYKTDEYFSPNNDGVKESAELHYRTLEPVHLEFNIYDKDNVLVRTLDRDHSQVGEFKVVWDGRDEYADPVEDGIYVMKLFDYEFKFIIDTSLPEVFIQPHYYLKETGALYGMISGYVIENNAKKMVLESGKGDNPETWDLVEKRFSDFKICFSEDSIKRDGGGKPELKLYAEYSPALLTGRRFRLTVEDQAGNVGTWTSDMINEVSYISRWNDYTIKCVDYSSYTNKLTLEKLPVEGFSSKKNEIRLFHVLRKQGALINLQVNTGNTWIGIPETVVTGPGLYSDYTWDVSGQEFKDLFTARFKILSVDGVESYSEQLLMNDFFLIELIGKDYYTKQSHPGVRDEADEKSPSEKLIRLEFQRSLYVKKKKSDRPDIEECCADEENGWETYKVYSDELTSEIPHGKFSFSFPLDMGEQRFCLKMVGTLANGEQISSNVIVYPPLSTDSKRKIKTCYDPSYACETILNRAHITVIDDRGIKHPERPELPEGAEFYINVTGEYRLIETLSDISWGAKKWQDEGCYFKHTFNRAVEIETTDIPQGRYPIRVDIRYSGRNEVLDGELEVGKEPPQFTVTAPLESDRVCPRLVTDEDGDCEKGWYGIDVEIAGDNDRLTGEWECFFGYGAEPSGWHQVKTRVCDKVSGDFIEKPLIFYDKPECPQSPSGPHPWFPVHNGKKIKGVVTLLFKNRDKFGGLSCRTVTFEVKGVPYLSVDMSPGLISPNGDGISDSASIGYFVDEYSVISAGVYGVSIDSEGDEVLSLVDTLINDQPHYAGSYSVDWNPSGVEDGMYKAIVSVDGTCGETVKVETRKIEVDSTPPDLSITGPSENSVIGVIAEIRGTVTDKNIASYRLVAVNDGDARSPVVLAEGANQRVNSYLGRWNTVSFDGPWTLKLVAEDKAGNKSETESLINLGNRLYLIKNYDVSSRYLSPNGDGIQENIEIGYSLNGDFNENYDIVFEIKNSEGKAVLSVDQTNLSPGNKTILWDGRSDSGEVLADGGYSAVIKATLSLNPGVIQEESQSIVLDALFPEIEIEPGNLSFHTGDLKIQGSITDENMAEYSVVCQRSDSAIIYSDSGVEEITEHVLTLLDNLEEGDYTLEVKAKDLGGNVSSVTNSFVIDKTPPVVTLANPAAGACFGGKNAKIAVEGTIEEDHVDNWTLMYGRGENPEMWTTLVSGNEVPVGTKLFNWTVGPESRVPDGDYTLLLACRDKAGWETGKRLRVLVDNTRPEIEVASIEDGGYITEPVDIKGSVMDDNLKQYSVEVSEGECGSAFKWSSLKTSAESVDGGSLASLNILPQDGKYCLKVSAVDVAGNRAEETVGFTVDTVPPSAPVVSADLEDKINVTLRWHQGVETDLSDYNLYRNGKKINNSLLSETVFSDKNLIEGVYTYTLTAQDHAGLESAPSEPITVHVDITAPFAEISLPKDGSIINNLFNIKGSAFSLDDFKEYRVYMGEGENPENWDLIRRSPLAVTYGILAQNNDDSVDGASYSIRLEVEDIYGNENESRVHVRIDTVAPAAPVMNTPANPIGADAVLTWVPNNEADLAGYLIYRNGALANVSGNAGGNLKPYLVTGQRYDDSSLPDGIYEYYIEAMDEAGNISARSNTVTLTIDTRAPYIQIITPVNGTELEKPVMIKAESPDGDMERITWQYRKAGVQNWIDISTGDPLQFYANFDPAKLSIDYGDYELRIMASDLKNNEGFSNIVSVKYKDLTAPATPENLKTSVYADRITVSWKTCLDEDLAGYNLYFVSDNSRLKVNADIITTTSFEYHCPSDGRHAFEVTAVDLSENESRPSVLVTAAVGPSRIDQPDSPVAIRDLMVTGGNAAPGAMVDLFLDSGSGAELQGSVLADDKGAFSFSLTLVDGENRITAQATDPEGNLSKMSAPVVVVYDLPPLAPENLEASVANSDIMLTWKANGESDLVGYNVFRKSGDKWQKVNPQVVATADWKDSDVKNGTWAYRVSAVDRLGNESFYSNEASVVVSVAMPEAPYDLVVTDVPETGDRVDLCWKIKGDVSSFNVYRSTVSGTGYARIHSAQHSGDNSAEPYQEMCDADTGVESGKTYYYVVTVSDKAENESEFSNEASAAPVDDISPAAPVILAPALSGSLVDATSERTTVSGFAEPLTTIHLYKNRGGTGTISALGEALWDSIDVNTSYIRSLLYSGDGKTIAFIDQDKKLLLLDFGSGEIRKVGNQAQRIALSPDGTKLSFFDLYAYRSVVYDISTDKIVPLVEDVNSYLKIIAWSNVSSKVVFCNRSNGENIFWVKDIDNGDMIQIPATSVSDVAFSSNDKKLSYRGNGPDGSGLHLFDFIGGVSARIDDWANKYHWSPDGRSLAYTMRRENFYELKLYNTDTGKTLLVATTDRFSRIKWAVTVNKIAFTTYGEDQTGLNIYDVDSGASVQISDQSVSNVEWAPAGDNIAWTERIGETRALCVHGTETRIIKQTASGEWIDSLCWSPGGNRLVYSMTGESGEQNLCVASLNENGGEESKWDSFDGRIGYLNWSSSGEIFHVMQVGGDAGAMFVSGESSSGENVHVMQEGAVEVVKTVPAGYFKFEDVELDTGINRFYAISQDGAGNESPESDEVIVRLSSDLVSNLAVTESGIHLMPVSPLAGDMVIVNVDIRNTGKQAAEAIDVDVYLWGPDDEFELLSHETIGHLEGLSAEVISFQMDTSVIAGVNEMIVQVDADDQIFETDEADNYASKEFYVASEEGVSVSVSVDSVAYASGEDVNIDVGVFNSGFDTNASLELRIEDENGYVVTVVDTDALSLTYGSNETYTYLWSSEDLFAGGYVAKVVVKGEDGEIDEAVAPFKISTSVKIGLAVSADKTAYGTGEDVLLKVDVGNNGNVPNIPSLELKYRFMDGMGNELISDGISLVNLLSGVSVSENISWNTGYASPGEYRVAIEAYHDGNKVAEKQIRFSVRAARYISGSIAATPSVVMQNGLLTAEYQLFSAGNSSPGTVSVRVIIVDPETQATVGVHEQDIELVLNGSASGTVVFSASGLNLKAYRALLQYDDGGLLRNLASASFVVEDKLSPVLSILSPETGSTFPSDVNLSVEVKDNGSGVEKTEYRLDHGMWYFMALSDPAKGIYVSRWRAGSDDAGIHVLHFRAFDNAGNESETVSVQIHIENFDDLQPSVSVLSPAEGNIYDSAFELAVTAEDGESGIGKVEYRIDQGQWAELPVSGAAPGRYATLWEPSDSDNGTHTMSFRAVDGAGNISVPLSVSVIVQLYTPFEKLTGELSVVPGEVFQGVGTAFCYIITNETDGEIPSLRVMVHILDPVSMVPVKALEKVVTLPPGVVKASNINDPVSDLAPGDYLAVLKVMEPATGEVRVLDQATFNVRLPLIVTEVDPDGINLLVWVNDGCRFIEGAFENGGVKRQSCWKDCSRVDLIEKTVDTAATGYRIVYDRDEFENELRNPFYTDIVVLGDHRLPHLKAAVELIEKVNSGTGLISSLWIKHLLDTTGTGLDITSLFGVTWRGIMLSSKHEVKLEDTDISEAGSFMASGKGYKVHVENNASTVGWVQKDHLHHKLYPAVVKSSYGKGNTAYFSFDFGQTINDGNYEELSGLLTGAIKYVHQKKQAERLYPYRLAPVMIHLENPAEDFKVRVRAEFPEELKLYNDENQSLVSESSELIDFDINAGDSKSLFSYFLTPDLSGTYSVFSEAGIMNDGVFTPVDGSTSEISVGVTYSSLIKEIISDLRSLDVSFFYKRNLFIARKKLEKIQKREVVSKEDISKNIRDVISAVHILQLIRGTDLSEIRLKIDALLEIEESKYYFFNE